MLIPAFAGRLANALPGLETPAGVAIQVEPGRNRSRPLLFIADARRAIARAQRHGIPRARAEAIVHRAFGDRWP